MLSIVDLRRRYGRTIAVDGISLEVRAGEAFGLLGPNGAGKSTLVSLCAGLLRPDSGRVEILGSRPTEPRCRRRVGVAPQELALYDDLTASANIEFFGRLFGLHGGRLRERVAAALDFVGLSDRRGDRVRTFSGGMKRRLNLAVAIVHEPELLFLDEPTVGVDPQSRNAILDNVRALLRLGRTVVYTTHYMEEAERVCDRIGVVDRGRLLALGSVAELIGRHGGRTVLAFDRRPDCPAERIETDDPFEELARRRAAGPLGDFRVERPNLETVFLNLTGHSLRD